MRSCTVKFQLMQGFVQSDKKVFGTQTELMEEELLKHVRAIRQLLTLNKDMISLEEFCIYTGISKANAYKLTSGRKIPFYRPFGKKIYFDMQEVTEYLKHNRVESKLNVEVKANTSLLRKL